jgi:hypothetical protein
VVFANDDKHSDNAPHNPGASRVFFALIEASEELLMPARHRPKAG